MGQITSKINSKTAVWDFSVNGGNTNNGGLGIALGVAMDFTESATNVWVTALSPMVPVGVDSPFMNIGPFGFNFTLPNVATLNANIGFWLPVPLSGGNPIKLNTLFPTFGQNWELYFGDGSTNYTAGKLLFSLQTISTAI